MVTNSTYRFWEKKKSDRTSSPLFKKFPVLLPLEKTNHQKFLIIIVFSNTGKVIERKTKKEAGTDRAAEPNARALDSHSEDLGSIPGAAAGLLMDCGQVTHPPHPHASASPL